MKILTAAEAERLLPEDCSLLDLSEWADLLEDEGTDPEKLDAVRWIVSTGRAPRWVEDMGYEDGKDIHWCWGIRSQAGDGSNDDMDLPHMVGEKQQDMLRGRSKVSSAYNGAYFHTVREAYLALVSVMLEEARRRDADGG